MINNTALSKETSGLGSTNDKQVQLEVRLCFQAMALAVQNVTKAVPKQMPFEHP